MSVNPGPGEAETGDLQAGRPVSLALETVAMDAT